MIPFLAWRRLAGAVVVVLACLSGQAAWAAASSPASDAPAVSVPDTMEQRLAACTSCHGDHGMGSATDPGIPRLAGKPAAYLLQQMHYFQTGQRKHAAMEYVVRQLDARYLNRIATYFSAQDVPHRSYRFPAATEAMLARGKELVERGDPARSVPSCQSCHGPRLTGVKPMIPGLTGLSYAYLDTQLKLWRSHQRASGGTFCMGVVANRMRASDVEAVSAWLARQSVTGDPAPVDENTLAEPIPGWCVTGAKGGVR